MKNKRKTRNLFLSGVSTFDITGSTPNTKRHRRTAEQNIEASWHNVGVFLKRGFNKAVNKDEQEELTTF